MKIVKFLLIWCIASAISFTSAFAAGTVDHFQVKLFPENAKTWEALDLTIQAVDSNNAVVTGYKWTILIFSESDPEAKLPIVLEDNTYKFTASDQWKVIFENAVSFTKEWTQNIYVYDFNEDSIFGFAEAGISKWNTTASTNISILSPENWLVIWDNKVKVSGTSDKNHQIKLLINAKTEILTMTNDSWTFEREVTWLKEWDNSIQALVLDADWNEIWTSNIVKIKVEKSSMALTSAKANPDIVDSESAFEIQVIATPWLKQVQTVLNDVITILPEKESGKYIAKTYAPKDEWTYPINVILKDDLWHEVTEIWATSIKVNPALNSAEESTGTWELSASWATTETWATKEEVKEKDLKVKWLKLVKLKSKSILTWDKLEDAKSYNVYKKLENWELEFIENVTEPKFEILVDMNEKEEKFEYFAVKAVAEDDEWKEYEWDLSEATKIQTGPEMIILLIIALMLGWVFVWKQRKAQ